MTKDIPQDERLGIIERQLDRIQSLLKLSLLTTGGLPVTLIGNNFIGDNIGTTSRYIEIYRNNFQRLVALTVNAEFTVPGQKASLSLTSDPSNSGRVSLLSSTGTIQSSTIWLKPDQSLYINTADTAFSLNGSVFRVLLFDPLSFAGFLGGGI